MPCMTQMLLTSSRGKTKLGGTRVFLACGSTFGHSCDWMWFAWSDLKIPPKLVLTKALVARFIPGHNKQNETSKCCCLQQFFFVCVESNCMVMILKKKVFDHLVSLSLHLSVCDGTCPMQQGSPIEHDDESFHKS